MKKLLILPILLLIALGSWAQQEAGSRITTASQVIQKENEGINYTIQVGVPFLRTPIATQPQDDVVVDARFPWGALYIPNTFDYDNFDVSKGYFGDKILISWTLQGNQDLIDIIKVFRRDYSDVLTDQENPFVQISTVPSFGTEYEDQYVDGGVLYEYKIEAVGVTSIPQELQSFVTGIGYRSPTAIVTGSVNFEGGNPVKDVIIRATSQGGGASTARSLLVPANGTIAITDIENGISTLATLQAFVRPENPMSTGDTPITLFSLDADTAGVSTLDTNISLDTGANELHIDIAGSLFTISEFIPSGNLSANGDDILIPVSEFNTTFTHFSVLLTDGQVPQLYINGRPMTSAYVATTDLTQYPGFNISEGINTTEMLNGGATVDYKNIYLGGGTASIIDEMRIWNDAVTEENIRVDYRRFISGNNNNLVSYLRASEGVGQFAYDLARSGFNFKNNHGALFNRATLEIDKATWLTGTGNTPTDLQLGVLGVTDANGNYEITAIPYSGTGESFNITPILGVHEFDPNQQLVFLGQGSEVVNSINFTDVSSFDFTGRVFFDTRGVFPAIAGDEILVADVGQIDEVGYNRYMVAGDPVTKRKGEWWLNDNETPADLTDDRLEHYATIYSEGVNIYIDGQIVLDENNTPVVSDAEGFFTISVPIGNHFISIQKPNHEFEFEGRFPAQSGVFREFFEDSNQEQVFIDNTKVTLVGRIVGGSVEANKPIGFGGDGTVVENYTDDDGNVLPFEISSTNNIGVKTFTLDYPNSFNAQPETKVTITTNEETGEYRKDILPINYELLMNSIPVTITESAPGVPDTSAFMPSESINVNLKIVPEVIVPQAQLPDGAIVDEAPYHLNTSIVFRSDPVLSVIGQTSEDFIEADTDGDGVTEQIPTEGFSVPVYSQFSTYLVDLIRFERYTNFDGADPVETQDPIIDGSLLVTNNLALEGTESLVVDANDESIIHYSFKAGLPRISAPYTKTINLTYDIQGVPSVVENYVQEGIILGGNNDGTQTFLTAAPDIPDLILRDPPGSSSSATIESGETISFSTENTSTFGAGVGTSLNILLGVKAEAGGGLAGPVIESQGINEASIGMGVTLSSSNGSSLEKSYSFSQTISTSGESDFVGSEGDLYIGQSKNYSYGSYDDVFANPDAITDITDLILTNTDGDEVHIGKRKAMYFNEEPSETFFILSQKTILNTTIPELQLVIQNIDNGTAIPYENGIQPRSFYEQQINLWRKTILENERSKWRALNESDVVLSETITLLDTKIDELSTAIAAATDEIQNLTGQLGNVPIANAGINFTIDQVTGALNSFQSELLDIQTVRDLVTADFEDNISFDAGVGEFTRNTSTTTVNTSTSAFELEFEETFELQLGATFNKVGLINKTEGKATQNIGTTTSNSTETSTSMSYTFQDNDADNLLSVDVINPFNGEGPVFATVGGRTSCPYEGAEHALFFDPGTYDPANMQIDPLPVDTEIFLSVATQRVEVPVINVVQATVINVPETDNAEFVLLLENNSATETDASFNLRVDNTTNPDNALINIEPNGTIVNVPFGQQVEYALTIGKSISDVFVYDDIRIILESFCDGEDVSDDVFVSATFVPSCSSVVVSAPLDNFVFNKNTAFNTDGTSNLLPITMQGYNLAFNSFEKIVLEYRVSTAPNWSKLQSYYTTQAFFDDAVLNGESDISLINGATVSYAWDIVGDNIQDGNFEIRARTSCVNMTEYIGDPIAGTIDLTAPRRFNTPSPEDGILSSGDDIKVSFNEDIFYNSALSQISITGRTNQLPINNSVSVRYDGVNNTTSVEEPDVMNGDFSLEFWMLNETTAGTATILAQEEGLDISLTGSNLFFTIADVTVMGAVPTDGLFHHYTFTHDATLGSVSMYIDDIVTQQVTGLGTLQFTNDNNIIIGGNTFVGNIHDMRLWSKPLTLADAFANIYTDYSGNERNLIGYWPMDEGRGTTVADLARFNNMNMDAAWDIKPKGESYLFESGQYQTLDNVNFVQLNDEQDATISFWVKTPTAQIGTIFSNGRGDGTDLVQPNGLTNKWAIDMAGDGTLNFNSEGTVYPLTTTSVADDNWHHVVLLLNRNGNLRTMLDGDEVSANPTAAIGGFSGNRIWLGARGQTDQFNMITIDQEFDGQLDEFRLWNSLRNVEQVTRDQYMEVDPFNIGLLLYARMNEPDPATGAGPTYFHVFNNNTIITSEAVLNTGAVNYNTDVPPIKPEREVLSFAVNRVINGDEMILSPVVSDPASIEGQILDITVHRMFDAANNRQESPITWTAFVQKNDVSWFAPGYNDVIEIIKEEGENASFDITIVNQGGQNQPYAIDNIPSWLSITSPTGVLTPSSTITVTATISNNLGAGDYVEDLFLVTDFGLDQKLQMDLKVLAIDPVWAVNPNDYEYSMNIIGKVSVDGTFSGDVFDKVGAFVDGAARGEANLVYNEGYQEYFVFLTLYSNLSAGENVTFRIWDASQGSILPATIDDAAGLVFSENAVLGSLSQPRIFENTGAYIQSLSLNPGWTWISFNVNDVNFQDIDLLTSDLALETSDRIISSSPQEQLIELYYEDPGNPNNSGWDGTISSNGGLNSNQMFKVYTATQQPFTVEGAAVDIESLLFEVQTGWNWLPYPFNSNHSVNEALSTLELSDGDVIKSQNQFAVYDALSGWSGSLTTLHGGRGYMLRSAIAQDFSYPTFLNRSATFEDDSRNQLSPDDFASYNSNMNIVVQLPDGYDTVYAYNQEGDLRGVSKTAERYDDNLSFLTTYGDGDEALTFYVGNSVEQRETINAFHFINDGVDGSLLQPVVLSLGNTDVHIFPNPFDDQINLRFGLENTQSVTVSISNMIGQIVHKEVLEVQAGVQQHTLTAHLASGAYTMVIDLGKTTKIEKIIKN